MKDNIEIVTPDSAVHCGHDVTFESGIWNRYTIYIFVSVTKKKNVSELVSNPSVF